MVRTCDDFYCGGKTLRFLRFQSSRSAATLRLKASKPSLFYFAAAKSSQVLSRRLSLLLAVCSALVALPAQAQDNGVFVAGGQVGGHGSSYGQVGVIAPLPGSSLGNGWVARMFAEEISYRYEQNTTQFFFGPGGFVLDTESVPVTVRARGWGGSASVGYQYSTKDSWAGAYVGPAFRHTRYSTRIVPDLGCTNCEIAFTPIKLPKQNQVSARMQLEGEKNFTPDMKVNASGVYDAFANNDYWMRLRALHRVTGRVYAGPEGSYQGNDDYKAWQAGVAVTGIPVTEASSLGVDAGVRKVERVSPAGYVGIELGVAF